MMKNLQLISVLLFTLTIFSQEKALFVGNSMTYFNNMPNLFQEIANSKGKNVQAQYYAPGGTGFINHVNDQNVYSRFKNENWDIVVLQPGTSESAGVSSSIATTINRGKQMIDSIKKYSPCAKIFIYEIPYGIKATNNVPDYNNYFQIQTMIKDSITKLANGLRIPMVPAGECARNHFNNQQNLLLHNSYNDVHPNLNGSYLVACAMFNTIYQEEVSPSSYLGSVSQSNATYFQNISDNIVLNNKPTWLLNTYNLYAGFEVNINNLTVNFTNHSTNFDSVQWDFNLEGSSTEENPSFTFSSTGIKTIKLTAFKDGCSYVYTKDLNINNLNIEDFNKSNFIIFPNPTTNFVKIKAKESFNITIFNSIGQLIFTSKRLENEYTFNLEGYPSGIYFFKLNNKTFKVTKK